ncbi:hypothetical protein E2C01_096878 [Portunus trituberculatus]|uniref:Uncharacterized protein n=1 Tax=Portunus trituberculatus TaxID=210409 RepID=A0A5B7K368_PORTR|nr:hypothetical protein [Portunus trituberculatus]
MTCWWPLATRLSAIGLHVTPSVPVLAVTMISLPPAEMTIFAQSVALPLLQCPFLS